MTQGLSDVKIKTAHATIRARAVDINGQSERMELLLLTFVAPLWGLVMPIIGLTQDLSFIGFLMLGASVFCLLHFLHLQNNNFSFEKDGLRLPGVDHRVRPYKSITSVYIECLSPFTLAVQYTDPNKIDTDKAETKKPAPQIIEAHNLTEENARQLWQLSALYLRNSKISIEVRDRLLNWRRLGIDGQPQIQSQLQSQLPGPLQAQLQPVGLPKISANQNLFKDLNLSVELKPFNLTTLVTKYMESYSDTFRKTWLTFWCIVRCLCRIQSI